MKGSLAALVTLLAGNAYAAQEVTVYTAFETDILAKYKTHLKVKTQTSTSNGFVIQQES